MKILFKISCYFTLALFVVLAACAPSVTQKPDAKAAGEGSARATGRPSRRRERGEGPKRETRRA